MAHVEKRKRSRPGQTDLVTWRARYVDPEGRERSRTFSRKVDAERFMTTVEADKLRGSYIDPDAGRLTFGEYAETWRAIQVHRPTTRAQVETNLRRHAYPVLGGKSLGAVRPTHVQAWVRGLSETLAPGTVATVYKYVSSIFKAAVADRLIASSPCTGAKLPKKPRAQVKPLSVEQVQSLTAALPPRYRAMVTVAAGTGLRQGEVFGLELRHVAFLGRTLRVEQQLVLTPGAPPQIGPPKTEASYRTIPLPQVVIDALAAHLAAFPAADMVFTDDKGRWLRRTAFNVVWRRAVEDAGLPAGTGFHDLRHFYASLLIRHRESVKVVQVRLGHASAAETLDTYSHLWPDNEDETRQAVDSVLATRRSSQDAAATL